jgi:hypothetical protein
VSDHGGTIQGTIGPGSLATYFRVEYGTSGRFRAAVGGYAGSGSAPVDFSTRLEGLRSGTTYSYRVVAVSAAGEAVGATGSFTTTGTPQAADSKPPFVRALASSGRAGRKVELEYRVYDDISDRTRERITVYRGDGGRVARFSTTLGRAERGVVYYVTWRAPARLRGALRFCVESWDTSGNRSSPSCARLTLR